MLSLVYVLDGAHRLHRSARQFSVYKGNGILICILDVFNAGRIGVMACEDVYQPVSLRFHSPAMAVSGRDKVRAAANIAVIILLFFMSFLLLGLVFDSDVKILAQESAGIRRNFEESCFDTLILYG